MKFCEILPNKNYGRIHVRDRLEETDQHESNQKPSYVTDRSKESVHCRIKISK